VRQMPQVFINDQRVGGLAGLQAALAQMANWCDRSESSEQAVAHHPGLVFFLQLVLSVQVKVTCIVAFMQLCF
jgi:hypothetical protein